jgi:hypothetical protein
MRAKRITGGLHDAKAQVPWNRAMDRKNGQKPGTTVPKARLFLSKCHHIGAAQATIGKRDFSANMAESGALVDLEQERFGACRIQTTLNQAENPGSGRASNSATRSWSDNLGACSRINRRPPAS